MGCASCRRKIRGLRGPAGGAQRVRARATCKKDAERRLGPVRQVVITVPAFFDETRRRATQEAGRLAGLEVLDIINEPTAAAVAFGYDRGLVDARGPAATPSGSWSTTWAAARST